MTILMSRNVINVCFPPNKLQIRTMSKDELFTKITQKEVFFVDGENNSELIDYLKTIYPDTTFTNIGSGTIGMSEDHILVIIIDFYNYIFIEKTKGG